MSFAKKKLDAAEPNRKSVFVLQCLVFQAYKGNMREKEPHVTKVTDEANEALNSGSGTSQDLARRVMQMSALWTDCSQRVDRYSMVYVMSNDNYKEFSGKL